MKKKYEKPQVRMERFEMSVSVAACGWILAQDGSLKKDTTPHWLKIKAGLQQKEHVH